MANLLSICQSALKEIGDTNVPSTIIGNTDGTAVQLLALLTRSGKTLRRLKWQALIKTGTITTANGTQDYALPTDWLEFDPLTFWDATQRWDMVGPVTPALWNALSYSVVSVAGIRTFFRVAAGNISLLPIPTSVRTLNYTYRTKYWIASLSKEDFTDDTDTVALDDQLLISDLKWRYRRAKGIDDWQELKADADALLAELIAADGGKSSVNFGYPRVYPPGNLPESGYGV